MMIFGFYKWHSEHQENRKSLQLEKEMLKLNIDIKQKELTKLIEQN